MNEVREVSRDGYDLLDMVNWSTLKHLGKSPAHYRHNILQKDGDTAAKKLGRCAHLATLEPEKFRLGVAKWTGDRRAGKEWEAFKAKNQGRELLTEDEHDYCLRIAEAARSSEMAKPYLAKGKSEQTVLWSHIVPPIVGFPGYRVECKGRLDFIADCGALVDLKTTKDASPEGFGREFVRYGYGCQAAFYRDGYKAATGLDLPYVIVAVETSRPHVVQVYRVQDEVLEMGRDTYRALLDRLQLCRAENAWPGYADAPCDLVLPRWALPDDDSSDLSELNLSAAGGAP